jgi:hypothetical protein
MQSLASGNFLVGDFLAQCVITNTRNSRFGPRNNYTFTMDWLGAAAVDGTKTIFNGTTQTIRFASIRSVDPGTTNGIVRIRQEDSFLDDAWDQGVNGPKPEWDIEVRISQKNAQAPLLKRYTVALRSGDYLYDVKERS